MSSHPFTSPCKPMPADCHPASEPPAGVVPPGSYTTPVLFAQALNTNLLSVVYTFGMPFGECLVHMTFRMQTTQRKSAPVSIPERRLQNHIPCISVG